MTYLGQSSASSTDRGSRRLSEREIYVICQAEHDAGAPEHPDTIALRECRAQLEATTHNYNDLLQQRNQLENEADSARAERNTARQQRDAALDDATALETERDTALARIAELEANQPYAHEGRKRDGKGGYEQD